ncbi:TerB N-terminal domain-containing protein [Legionella pneumophila]|uniref:tellurite resistance TerB family protein n=1 Tax=Legionella pneumophila TaxID=446 RepID=UPI00138ED644|nr:TerB N-terminal domain-containing protein [Legionella pneumophila]
MASLLIFFIIYIIYKRLDAGKKTHSTENFTEFHYEVNDTRPSGMPAKWYGFKEDTTVNNINIKGGLIYVGEVLLDIDEYENDASLINPKLGILPAKSWEHGDLIGYWSRYSQIPEQCRGAYLNWLATNRSEPEANIGYVFLFFYGLERRIFVDSQKYTIDDVERNHIIDEVKRLLTIYGNNRSFRGYANNFLATEWILYHRDKPPPNYIDFNDRYCLHAFQFLLAQYVASGKPIPADIALQWLILHPDFSIKTPARRCPKEFLTLFCYKYREKFGDGLIITPNKTRLILEYRAASPSLRMLRFENINLPNPFILTTPAKSIYDLIEECTNELEQYSRYLSRKNTNAFSVNALALLPNILISQISPLKQIQNKLTDISSGKIEFISINTIYDIFGETQPANMNIKDSASLSIVLEGLGFGIIPDSRFYNISFNENSKVIIFTGGHGQDFSPSREFHIIGTIIRLGSIVAQVGEGISSKEENTLQKIIRENNQLSSIERVSLMIFLYWCLRTPQTTAGLQKKLEIASTSEKQAISSILISVALADGRIESEEIKQLEKLYTTLGLDKRLVSSDIHQLTTAYEPVTVGLREKEINYQIPTAHIEKTSHESFSLNENLVKIREEETRQVKGILEEIFTERENISFYQAPPPTNISKDNPLLLLDQNYQSLFKQLIIKENWNKIEVHDACKKLGLMTDGAMEVLNQWSFNLTNAPLLEDGEVIYVDINLAEEILNVQRT